MGATLRDSQSFPPLEPVAAPALSRWRRPPVVWDKLEFTWDG